MWKIGLFLILGLLSGCETALPVSDFCLLYKPIYTHNKDTPETMGQIIRNNAVWLAHCTEEEL